MCTESQRVHIYRPADMVLFKTKTTLMAAQTRLASFIIPTPSLRITMTGKILIYPENSSSVVQPMDVTSGGIFAWALSVQAAEKTPTEQIVPTVNIVGSGVTAATTMQSIPLATSAIQADNLMGFSSDVTGGQDYIIGTLACTLPAPATFGQVMFATLRVKYELTGTEMSDFEWDRMVQQMSPSSGGVQGFT